MCIYKNSTAENSAADFAPGCVKKESHVANCVIMVYAHIRYTSNTV